MATRSWASGRKTRAAARTAAYGGGVVGTMAGVGAALRAVIHKQAQIARATIGEPTGHPPQASGSWGEGRPGTTPLRLCVIGDSGAAGLGAQTAEETPGGRLAGALARELERRVLLDVVASVGARSADLDAQVARAMTQPIDLAMIMVGTNDVTHRVSIAAASRDLGRAVATLRAAGVHVVVGTCPDLGTVEPLLQPLKTVAAKISRRMARAQTVAVVEAGGTSVSLGDLLGEEFGTRRELWSHDRFHPSAEGYGKLADVFLPVCLDLLGAEVPGAEPVADSVQHVDLAATVASRDPGLTVEAVEGESGAAATGPGRLVRLVRRLPLVGRCEPEGRTDDVQ
ncbi:MAG: hydrolase family protein, partial [Frankiales bacterium]|nr:hydrolase family protein [Frankiales bacterium]